MQTWSESIPTLSITSLKNKSDLLHPFRSVVIIAVLRPESLASASPGNLLELPVLGPHHVPIELETLVKGPSNLYFKEFAT